MEVATTKRTAKKAAETGVTAAKMQRTLTRAAERMTTTEPAMNDSIGGQRASHAVAAAAVASKVGPFPIL
jgi:hypothetical protein